MKNKLTLVFAALYCSMVLYAKGVKIGDLYYNLNSSNKTAEVTFQKSYSQDNYSGLTSAIIPSSVTYNSTVYRVTGIGDNAFGFCTNLMSVTIPNSVTSIGSNAFSDCIGLTRAIIPNSVTSIGSLAFSGCRSLTSVTIPNSITSIEYGVFSSCKKLTSVTIPNGVTSIGGDAFSFCSGLTNVTIPNGVTSIGERAFEYCGSLTNVTIPNSVTGIGERAFLRCNGLTSVTIPNSVISIGEAPFYDCKGLRAINVAKDNPNYCSLDGVLFNKNLTTLVQYPGGKQGAYSIPNGVASIGESAFCDCNGLTSVTIPNSVTSIGFTAFSRCENLTSVAIGNSVTSIGYKAFNDCSRLREVRYPTGLDLSDSEIPSTTKLIPYDVEPSSLALGSVTEPPLLALVNGSLSFLDPTNNNYIDANEKCTIKFKIQNNGKGAAQNCEARVKLLGTTSGISTHMVKLPSIAVGQTYEVSIPITSNINTENGKVTFSIEVYEPNGWGVAPFDLTVATKAYDAPLLQVVDYKIASNSGKIRKMEPFTLTFNLQNTKYGDAEDVKVKINIPGNVFVMDGSSELSYPIIKSGEVKKVQITLAANNNYAISDIPITIDIKEKYGKYAENKQLSLALNQAVSNSYQIEGKEEKSSRNGIAIATMHSDIDRNIPTVSSINNSAIVLIIANENYRNMPIVPYALNDGNVFREYCYKTLGIPQDNIMCIYDATPGDINKKLDLLQRKTQARNNAKKETNIIVYYTGHGVPDGNTRSAYLMPVDGYEENVSTGYKLDNLYQQLGQLPAKTITVFLDACFSGVNRNDEALAQHKGARLVAKSGMPTGNMVVFAASQGNQTAFVNDKEQHGLFTYYLLKKLQESKGDVTLDDLANYLTTEVNLKSLDLHEKEQIPSIIASPQVQNQWQNWKLK